MQLIDSIILGVVQGLTEFLPISSSAHLALLEQLFQIQNKLQITVLMHLSSVIAIIVAMRSEIKTILTKQLRLLWLFIIASIPAGVIGLVFREKISLAFENPNMIAVCLIITGIMLWLTRVIRTTNKNISPIRAFIIGIGQAIAILPGISRSGTTIATGIYLGVNRTEAAKFSFLLSIISVLGASALELPNMSISTNNTSHIIAGSIASFISSYIAIKYVLKIITTKKFALFAMYCWILGIIVLVT